MMALVPGIEPRCAPFHGYFAHQTCLYEVAKIVIDRGARRAGIDPIYTLENFNRRGMTMRLQKERHQGVPLRSAPQAAFFERTSDGGGVHRALRLYLI